MEVSVQVTAGAKKNAITEVGERSYRVWVRALPEKGKANAAVLALLAKQLGVAPSTIALKSGGSARIKRFNILYL